MTWGVLSYNALPGSNTNVNGVNIAEGCNASGINDAIRQVMADIAAAIAAGTFVSTTGTILNATHAVDATKLATARTITLGGSLSGSASFDGSANISLSATLTGNAPTATKLATARTLSFTGDATGTGSFDGSANLSTTLTVSHATAADSAAKLTTARAIALTGGITGTANFDGTAGISIATTIVGNAPTASKWATARTLSLTGGASGSGSIDGSGNVSIALTLGAPSTIALGGVNSKAAVSHQFLTAINTDGSVSAAQPVLADISDAGTAAAQNIGTSGANVGLLNASKTDSGNNTYSGTSAFTGQATFSKQANGPEGALTDGTSIAWDLSTKQGSHVTLAGNRTLANPTNMVAGGSYVLKVTQDATGGRTLAYGTAYKWPGGNDPILSTAAGAIDLLTFYCDGTSMYGVAVKAFS